MIDDDPTGQHTEPDGEDKELAKLEARADFGRYIEAGVNQAEVRDGPEAELNKHLNIGGLGAFPLRLIAPQEEERAATALTIDTTVRPASWLQRLFKGSVSESLGITMRSVPAGVAAYPVTNGSGAAKSVGKAVSVDDAEFSATVEELDPVRMQISTLYSAEDAHRIPMLSDQIMADMRMAMVDGMANETINGSADGSSIDGILDETAIVKKIDGSADGAITGATNPSEFISGTIGLVDGIHAQSLMDIRMLLAPEPYAHYFTQYDATGNSLRGPVLGNLRSDVYGIQSRATDHIGAVANDEYYVIYSLARGLMGAAVCPVWQQGQVLVDALTKSQTGQIRVTLAAYWNFDLIRPSNFAVRRIATAA